MDLLHGHFSVKMYAKTKELGPIGGGRARRTPPPPRSANEFLILFQIIPFVEKTFTFEDVPAAFEKVKNGHNRGKTVIEVIASRRNEDNLTDSQRKDTVTEPGVTETQRNATQSKESRTHEAGTS